MHSDGHFSIFFMARNWISIRCSIWSSIQQATLPLITCRCVTFGLENAKQNQSVDNVWWSLWLEHTLCKPMFEQYRYSEKYINYLINIPVHNSKTVHIFVVRSWEDGYWFSGQTGTQLDTLGNHDRNGKLFWHETKGRGWAKICSASVTWLPVSERPNSTNFPSQALNTII